MANTRRHSEMFNFRINKNLWEKVKDAVKNNPAYFSYAQFLRDALREKLQREVNNG